MENQREQQSRIKEPICSVEKLPEMMFGVKLTEDDKEKLSFGEYSDLKENLILEDGSVKNGKLKISINKHGNLDVHTFFQKETLEIPDKILDTRISKKNKNDLENGKVLGPIPYGKTDFYLKVDSSLNRVVVNSAKDMSALKGLPGYEFTKKERDDFVNGKQIPAHVYKGDNGYFVASIRLTSDKRGVIYSNPKQLSQQEALDLIKKLNSPKSNLVENVIAATKNSLSTLTPTSNKQAPENSNQSNQSKNDSSSSIDISPSSNSSKDSIIEYVNKQNQALKDKPLKNQKLYLIYNGKKKMLELVSKVVNIPSTYKSVKLTKTQQELLKNGGMTGYIDSLKAGKGETYTAKLFLDKNGRIKEIKKTNEPFQIPDKINDVLIPAAEKQKLAQGFETEPMKVFKNEKGVPFEAHLFLDKKNEIAYRLPNTNSRSTDVNHKKFAQELVALKKSPNKQVFILNGVPLSLSGKETSSLLKGQEIIAKEIHTKEYLTDNFMQKEDLLADLIKDRDVNKIPFMLELQPTTTVKHIQLFEEEISKIKEELALLPKNKAGKAQAEGLKQNIAILEKSKEQAINLKPVRVPIIREGLKGIITHRTFDKLNDLLENGKSLTVDEKNFIAEEKRKMTDVEKIAVDTIVKENESQSPQTENQKEIQKETVEKENDTKQETDPIDKVLDKAGENKKSKPDKQQSNDTKENAVKPESSIDTAKIVSSISSAEKTILPLTNNL